MRVSRQLPFLLLLACTAADPLVITKGGTYTGTHESNDAATPAVRVATPEPVVLENMVLRSRGHLIEAAGNVDLVVRKVTGTGLVPNLKDRHVGRFLTVNSFRRVVVENCTLDHTAGIYLYGYAGDRSPAQTFKILRNVARNIDGRYGDGNGGLRHDRYLVQFFQTNNVRDVRHAEVAWNEVINTPGESAVEDNVNLFDSSGSPDSPIDIHDNFIRGAYPPDPKSPAYSGGGILLADWGSSHVTAHHNQVVDTTNYGIAIASGHDNRFHANRIVSAGLLPDGTPIPAQNVGAYIWNTMKDHADRPWRHNTGHDNVIGWVKGAGRNDWWTPDAAADGWTNNRPLPSPITRETVDQEYRLWREKVRQAGVRLGAGK